jgi:hypothetical protein
MTFVAKELVVVYSVPIPHGEPLKAPHGSSLWMLTVSVRNDGETPASEPFCHGSGADLQSISKGFWAHSQFAVTVAGTGWSKDSLLYDPDHQIHHWRWRQLHPCNDIPPGSTETFQLLYYALNRQGAMTGVLLFHHSPEVDKPSAAFVAFAAR